MERGPGRTRIGAAFVKLEIVAGLQTHGYDDINLGCSQTIQANVKGVWWGCRYAILAMCQNPTDKTKDLHIGTINTAVQKPDGTAAALTAARRTSS